MIEMNKIKVSAVIMTLNAGNHIAALLDSLMRQTRAPDEIIIADSESDDETVSIAGKYSSVKVVTIKRGDFDHGTSRDAVMRVTAGDYVLFFTQDVVVGDELYVENILAPFADEQTAMVCGRQVARSDAFLYEKYVREFNYPDKRNIRTAADIPAMGIKTFYMSNACSAYRKDIYMEIGGFEHSVFTNEDMLIALHAIKAGYKTIYEPSAYVYHSHNYSCLQEYRRNRAISAFMSRHQQEFRDISLAGEGFRLVRYVSLKLLKGLSFVQFVKFGCICLSKYAGNQAGK